MSKGISSGKFFAVRVFLLVLFSLPVIIAMASPISSNAAVTTPFNLNARDIQLMRAWRMQDGDDPEWRKPGFDDSGWPAGSPNQLPHAQAGVRWLRAHIELSGTQNPFDVLVLRFSKLPVAFDVYWDGVRVGENGRVGRSEQDEIPGQVAFMIKLPRKLTAPGPHLLAIRYSNFHQSLRPRGFWAVLAYHADWLLARAKDMHLQYLWLGIYLISTFLSLALFLGGGRHRAFLVFAIYSLLLTLYLAINPLLEVFNADILFSTFLFAFRYLVFLCAGILLNIFFIQHFDIPRKRIHIPVVILLPLLIDIFQIRYLFGIEWRDTALMCYAIGLLVYAVTRRKAGSLIALIGFLAVSLPTLYGQLKVIFQFLPEPDLRIVLPLSLCFIPSVILSISRQIREQNRFYEAARNRSQRLEKELLKSQIHPHFISNTLHSAKSWIRDDPLKAEKLLQTL
ncbi:MAG: histidine kinase, partial [Chrysiogenales bacterium]